MKVISLHNPNALFVAHGYQTILTQAFDTNHRGWVAIHATKNAPNVNRQLVADVFPFADCLARINNERVDRCQPAYYDPNLQMSRARALYEMFDQLPKGMIVGLAWLARTTSTTGITERWNRRELLWKLDDPDYNDVPAWEPSFGDYSRGRVAWWLTHPIALATPIVVDGLTGLWDTLSAAERDRRTGAGITKYDGYEEAIMQDLYGQDILKLPEQFDEAFWRQINRRGEVGPTTPRNQ